MADVVIAHDYLTQRGGAERVVLALLEAFPDARVVTSLYAPDRTYPEFRDIRVETLLPGSAAFGRDARLAFPFLAPVFSRHVVRDADVVICSSSGWSHGIGSVAPKVVYCHTPARWLYVAGDYVLGHSTAVRAVARVARRPLLRWDRQAAGSAAQYVANSSIVAERVRRAYGRTAEIVHPPSVLDPAAPQDPVPVEGPFYLAVARRRGYKYVQSVRSAAAAAGVGLFVVEGGLTDAQLRWLYANCRGLVAAGHEDFGLTPVEAMSFGKPVLALHAGGYLDSVVDGLNGSFFEPGTLPAALAAFDESTFDADAIRRHAAAFTVERFSERMREIVAAL